MELLQTPPASGPSLPSPSFKKSVRAKMVQGLGPRPHRRATTGEARAGFKEQLGDSFTAMETPSLLSSWCPGDIAVIADGEFAGMQARVWQVDPSEGMAVVSLRVFSEGSRFEIRLSRLRRPGSQARRLLKALGFALVTLASGPLLWFVIAAAAELIQGRSAGTVFSWEETEMTKQWRRAAAGPGPRLPPRGPEGPAPGRVAGVLTLASCSLL